jgi:hypothetical protein
LEVAKVNGKTPNFHSFLGISLEIGLFSSVFAVFSAPTRKLRCDLAAFFLRKREEWLARNHAIPARMMRFCAG